MTNDPTPNRNDPLRALDAVKPAGTWDDVVARSTEGELLELAPVAARRSFPRPLLAAAAVLAVVALAGGVFAMTRGDDGKQTVAAEGDRDGGAGSGELIIWNSTWELVALERDGQQWDVEPNGETWPRLSTTQQVVGGISYQACNQGTGTATVEGDRLVVTELSMTEMYCATSNDLDDNIDSTLMDQESFVTDLLIDRPAIGITSSDVADEFRPGTGLGDRLTLTTAKGSATFERIEIGGPVDGGNTSNEPHELWGRMWDVVSATDGGQPKFFPQSGVTANVQLNATTPGRLWFHGCNGFGGQFELDGGRLKVIEIGPSTAMGCEQDLMDQDVWLQAFLEAEPTVAIDGDNLTLTTDDATIELEAADVAVGQPVAPGDTVDPDGSVSSPPQDPGSAGDPGPTESIQPSGPEETVLPSSADLDPAAFWGRTWNVVTITDQGRERPLVAPIDGEPLRLEAADNESTAGGERLGGMGMAGFNGCNGAGGQFDLVGDRLVQTLLLVEKWAVRDKRCEPASLMKQDDWFQTFLAAGPVFAIDGDRLTLTTDQATIDLVAS